QREVPLDAAHGTYLYRSLQLLFDLINQGHRPENVKADGRAEHGSGALVFENLDADLYRAHRTALIDEVRLGNQALQAVLENLLLSRVKKGKNRGFISYVALGINQLGAVYESLMSYTGSFADQDLVEVAKGGDPKGGSWVVPEDVIDESMTQHVVMVEDETGRKVPRTYRHGEFVFRLSGRARQQSASYYSPEVITSFTVSQGLAELLDPVVTDETDLPDGAVVFADKDFDGDPIRRRRTTAAELLNMSLCEPALGSGAFAIEAARHLAAEYLARRRDGRRRGSVCACAPATRSSAPATPSTPRARSRTRGSKPSSRPPRRTCRSPPSTTSPTPTASVLASTERSSTSSSRARGGSPLPLTRRSRSSPPTPRRSCAITRRAGRASSRSRGSGSSRSSRSESRNCGASPCAVSAPRRSSPAERSRCGVRRPARAVRSLGSRSRRPWRMRTPPTSACAW